MHDPDDLAESLKRLSNGSTVGMVDAALKEKGVGSGPREEVMEMAKRIINRRARIKHAIIATIGLLVCIAGGFWLFNCVQNRDHGVRIPGATLTFGLLALIYGVYFMTQDEV